MNREQFFALLDGTSSPGLQRIQRAYAFAKDAHRLQTRDSGERYFEHPRDVGLILIGRGYRDPDTVSKALMHDVIEDTYTTPAQIVDNFGAEMWRSLFRLAKYIPVFDPVHGKLIGRYKKPSDTYFKELTEGPMQDQLVKLADRYHNMRSNSIWVPERRVKYAIETRDFLLPIAKATDPWFERELTALVAQVLE